VEFEVYQGLGAAAGRFDPTPGTLRDPRHGKSLVPELTAALVGVCALGDLDAVSYESISPDNNAGGGADLALPVTRTLEQLLSFRLQQEAEKQTQRARDAVLFATEDLHTFAAQGSAQVHGTLAALAAWGSSSSGSAQPTEVERIDDDDNDGGAKTTNAAAAAANAKAALHASLPGGPLFSLSALALQKSCVLTCRVVPPPPSVKRVYFIRHGQSEWNRATEDTYSVRMALPRVSASTGFLFLLSLYSSPRTHTIETLQVRPFALVLTFFCACLCVR
jgi:hypothetical protein